MSPATDTSAKARILVVEDDAVIGMGLANHLEKAGYQVIDVVPTGEQAIRTAQSLSPDLVLMDIKLKGDMDGIQAAGEIRTSTGLPIVFLTAHEDDQLIERAKKTEPFGYLVKPYGERELHRTIQMALYKADMERKLQESQARYRDLVELAPVGIYLHHETYFVYVNRRVEVMLGYSADELTKMRFWEIFHPELQEPIKAQGLARYRGEPAPSRYESRLMTKSGETRWVEISAVPTQYRGKVATTGTFVDITERKLSEEGLLRSEERYRSLFEQSRDAIAIVREGGEVVAVNESVAELLGYTREEVLAMNAAQVWANPADRARWQEEMAQKGSLVDHEWRARKKDGTIIDCVLTSTTHRCEDGSPAYQTVWRDISAQKKAQEALKKSRERYRALLGAIPDPVVVYDTEGKATYINDAFTETYGWNREEVLGRIIDFVPPEETQKACESWERLFHGDSQLLETKRLTKNGDILDVQLRIAGLREEDGNISHIIVIHRDVTEIKKTYHALLESEKRYRQVIETTNDAVYLTDHLGRFTFLNPVALRRSGHTAEQLIGQPFTVTIHPDYREETSRFYVSQFSDKVPETYYELPVLATHGEIIWIGQNVQLVMEGDRIVGFQSIARDITDRKRMERKLAASEERFRTISECLPDAVLVIQDGKIVKSNPAVKHILGYQEEELQGKPVSIIYPPDTESSREEILNSVHVAGSVFEGIEYIRADGSIVLLDLTFATIPWDNDSAFLITLRDSTERIAAEKAVRQAKEEWERTFHAVPDLIAIIDCEHRIQRVNRAMAQRLGIGLDEVIDLKCHEAIHGTNHPVLSCPHAALIEDGLEHSSEVFEKRLGGTFHVTASPLLDSDGRLVGCVHVARDITEQKLSEEQQRELMEELKGFTYFVSHDLRGPLINVTGFSRALESAVKIVREAAQIGIEHLEEDKRPDVSEALEERIPESLHFIASSVSQMDHLTSAIMVLSRTERRELFFGPLNMDELVSECLNSLAYQIGTANTKVTVDPLPETVADRTAMEQVFANLIGNAIKYLEPGCAGTIRITGRPSAEETIFSITDNGRGIEKSDLSRIFQVFQRAGKSDVSGEGMGLAHVRTLVRRHGGRIWCESEPGVGSTFTFTISDRLHREETRS